MKASCETSKGQAVGVGLSSYREALTVYLGFFRVVASVLAFREPSHWLHFTIRSRMFSMGAYDALLGHRGTDMEKCF